MEEKDAAIQLHRQRVGEEEQRDRRPIRGCLFRCAFYILLHEKLFCGSCIYVSDCMRFIAQITAIGAEIW